MEQSTPRNIDPALVRELIAAAEEAADAMCDSLNLDLAVGNDEFEDVQSLGAALDRLAAALASIESSQTST